MSIAAVWSELQALVHSGCLERAFDLASRLLSSTPEAQHAAQRALSALLPKLSGCALSPSRMAVARRLGLPVPTVQDRVGQVDFPAVHPERSRFVTAHCGHAEGSDRILPVDLPPETRESISDALQAVRMLTHTAQRFEVVLDATISGRSCGLAVALAAYSSLLGRPLSGRLAATGQVRPDGPVTRVSDMALKLRLRAEDRPGCMLLVPDDVVPPHEQIIPIRSLQHAVDWLGGHASLDLDDALIEIRKQFRQGSWLAAAERTERVLDHPVATESERVELLTVLLCAANHTGRTGRAAELVEHIDKLLDHDLAPGVAALALASCLVATVDSFQAATAHTIVERIARHAWSPADLVPLRGAQALFAVYEDRIADAVYLRRQNSLQAHTDERPRCLADLADALRRLGQLDDALAAIDEALAELSKTVRRFGYQQHTQPFVHLHAARIHRARGEKDLALHYLGTATPSRGPDPSLRLCIEHALVKAMGASEQMAPAAALSELAEIWSDRPALHESGILRALYLRGRIEAGDHACVPELAALMGFSPLSVSTAELCRRLPY